MERIAVIGAGVAGLSCAYELKRADKQVTVFEKQTFPGGRMSTRKAGGFSFDVGANFYVAEYKSTKGYCEEFGIPFEPMPGTCYTTFQGRFHALTIKSIFDILNYDLISPLSRIRLLWTFARMSKKMADLDFFDLSTAPESMDFDNGYDFSKRKLGKDTADRLVDGFTSTYQFHRSDEISTAAMLSLIGLMGRSPQGFQISHAKGEMSALSDALAKRLDVRYGEDVSKVFKKGDKISIISGKKELLFDKVVLATTADIAKQIFKDPSVAQKKILDAARYSKTINVSFTVPKDILKGLCIITVPYIESKIICEYTNEVHKGIVKGRCLVNVGLHEEYAKNIMGKKDSEIFKLVGDELARVCPRLRGKRILLKPHDLIRWDAALPKYYHGYVSLVKRLLPKAQGENGIYLCGDYLNAPWVEGSIQNGKNVANLILRDTQ